MGGAFPFGVACLAFPLPFELLFYFELERVFFFLFKTAFGFGVVAAVTIGLACCFFPLLTFLFSPFAFFGFGNSREKDEAAWETTGTAC